MSGVSEWGRSSTPSRTVAMAQSPLNVLQQPSSTTASNMLAAARSYLDLPMSTASPMVDDGLDESGRRMRLGATQLPAFTFVVHIWKLFGRLHVVKVIPLV